MPTYKLIQGDCLDVLKTLPDNSVDAVVTDPPYELGFMGKRWDASGIAYNVSMWSECLRVLKPGGHLLSFGGSRTYHRMACAIEDAGFEVRDSLHWVYGSGFPKSRNLDGAWEGWGTALKPSHEPVIVARKPLISTVAVNVQQYGTGALNIDASRVTTTDSLNGGAYAKEGKERHDGDENWRFKREGGAGEFQQPAGRWPPNLLLSHTPECESYQCIDPACPDAATYHDHPDKPDVCAPDCPVAEMDRQSGVSKSVGGRIGNKAGIGAHGIYGAYESDAVKGDPGYGDTGGASRFFPVFKYQAKASRKEREKGCEDLPTQAVGMSGGAQSHGEGYDAAQSIGLNRVVKVKNIHPTVKPIALMEWLCKLVTPPNGTVLDPFTGSGTTGIAALHLGFHFIGIERDLAYFPIAEARLEAALPKPPVEEKQNPPSQADQLPLFPTDSAPEEEG